MPVASAPIPKLNAASDPAKGGCSYCPTRALDLEENPPCCPNECEALFARSHCHREAAYVFMQLVTSAAVGEVF
jgi:hypothetical protein